MIKRLWLFSMIPFFLHGSSSSSYRPKETIFLWDIHHVLLKPHGIIKAIAHYPHKRAAIRNSRLRRKALGYAIKSAFKSVSSEEFIALGSRYRNSHFANLVILASTAQKPLDETIAIIRELYEQGYAHHIGSNIGHTVFQEITNSTRYPQFKQIFQYFDLSKSHVVTFDSIGHQKPNPQFFCEYLQKNNINLQKTRVIFIDDKLENVIAAQQTGLDGIQFKNASQLRSELVKRNISIRN